MRYCNWLLYFTFTDDSFDDPFNGTAPSLWSITIQLDDMFMNYEKYFQV